MTTFRSPADLDKALNRTIAALRADSAARRAELAKVLTDHKAVMQQADALEAGLDAARDLVDRIKASRAIEKAEAARPPRANAFGPIHYPALEKVQGT